MSQEPSAFADCISAINTYIDTLKSFTFAVKKSQPKSEESQSELVSKLDPIFDIDKRLQDSIKKVNKLNVAYDDFKDCKQHAIVSAETLKELQEELYEKACLMRLEISKKKEEVKLIQTKMNSDSFLALGERIANVECPPKFWQADQPLVSHRPPYPTEDLLRSSLQFQIMNIGIAVSSPAVEENVSNLALRERRLSFGGNGADEEQNPSFLDLDLNPDLL